MKFAVGLVVACILFSVTAHADQLTDGIEAYNQKDFETALKLLKPLADQDNSEAQLQIGLMYLNGYGVPHDPAQGALYLKKAEKNKVAPSPPVVKNFKWEDYSGIYALEQFAIKYFPIGTSRSYIDEILIEQGKAKWSEEADRPAPKLTTVYYTYKLGGKWDCSRGIVFVFDQRNETVYQAYANKWSVDYRPFNLSGGCNAP